MRQLLIEKIFQSHKIQAVVCMLALLLAVPLPVGAVAATTDCELDFYSRNDIPPYYNPCASALSCTVGSNLGSVTSSADNAEAIFKYLTGSQGVLSSNGGKALTAIQAAAFMGNFYAESGYDPGAIQSGKAYDESKALNGSIGGYGFGLAQWDGGRRVALLDFAKSSKKPWNDLLVQLDYLKKELNGSESAIIKDSIFATTKDVAEATGRVRAVFERANVALAHDDKRVKAAREALAQFQDLAPGIVLSSGGCSTAGGNGDIASTAKALSWSKRASEGATDHKSRENKPEYTAALKSTGVNKLGDSCSMAGNSCDAFLATVMRFSGVDPNFPCCGSGMQNDYMKSHPDLYKVISTNVNSTSELQAGDLLWRSGHVKIYIGDGREAAASHCERTGEQSTIYLTDGTYTAYRFIGGGMSV